MLKHLSLIAAGAALAALAVSVPAVHAYEPKKDWPCVQVKVPDLSYGMVWTGPPLEGEMADWRASPEAGRLGKKLTVRRYTEEEVAQFVKEYADTLPDAGKTRELTRVFAAAFHFITIERKDVISGIERFTRRQRELADQVRATRKEFDASLAIEDPTDEQMEKRREIENRLNWETRIFDDREKSTKYVCEVPTLLEQRLFLIGRDIANQLP
jgi:hypothetical protein